MTTGTRKQARGLRESLLSSQTWRCIGPHRGGRVVAVAGDVSEPMTFYFGACAGGVWKTTDGGTYWHNVSDGYFQTAAVGAIAVSRSDPNVIYAGTGETCVRGNVSHGDGVYKSTDGGRSWTNVGLAESRHIGKIVIHPHNSDLVYVAALGNAFAPNEERGVFRSRDGGQTWEKVLAKSPHAGSHDVAMDPNNPRILFAAIWQVRRYPHALVNGGEECGLWRSTDGGDTWEDITRATGLPTGLLGKIGVAVSPAKSGRVWALIEAEDGAMFRSDDYGATWDRLSEQALLRTRPWYYMHVTADPGDADTVWVQNYGIWKSIDGGGSFTRLPSAHGDEHALWIDPNDTRRMIKGDDGGACVTFNGGASWSTIYNQPTAQLYHVTTDDQTPYRVYGSQQDNSAISLPSRTTAGAIHERDWYSPGGGESGYISVKPDDPNIVVGSGPVGRHAYNDVMTLYDHRTRQAWNITVWPELYGWGAGAESLKYRFQWTFPIMFSRHDPDVLYVAGNRLFRSTNLGANWEVVSDDLTRNDPEKLKPSGGPITRDNTGAEVYCTIFALAESPLRAGLLWAGSDDGLIHVSEDHGRTWRNVTPPDLPEWALISIIEPSPTDPGTAYVAATRYKLGDTTPYLFKTTDYGESWTSITDGIPSYEFTRVVRCDPNRGGLLYAGTETGLYVSFDDGGTWQRLKGNLPVVPIHDLAIKGVEMVVATHGRAFWIHDDLTPLHQVQDDLEDSGAHLFKPRPTTRMRAETVSFWNGPVPSVVNYTHADTSVIGVLPTRRPDGSIAEQLLDAGENPPAGVIVHYFLQEKPEEGISLAILDAEGNELRTFTAAADKLPAESGLNRFVWNMRLPGAPKIEAADLEPSPRPDGPLVVAGSYQARLTVAGQTQTQPIVIEPDPRVMTSAPDLQAQHDFLAEILAALTRTNETINQVDRLRGQLEPWKDRITDLPDDAPVRLAAAGLGDELESIRGQLIDVNRRGAQLWPAGLQEKLVALFESVDSADYAPPQQARDVFVELQAQLDELTQRFGLVTEEKAKQFDAAAREAGLSIVGLAD